MSAKVVFVLCAQAFFIQTAFTQCTSRAAIDASGFGSPYSWAGPSFASPAYERMAAPGLAYDGFAPNWAGRGPACNGFYAPAMEFTATSGGGLPVTSMSSISPTGISVISENAYEGALSMIGELPFVSAVAMEGRLPTVGAGAIDYGCGNGVIAMLSEGIAPAAYGPNAAMASGAFGPIGAYGPTGAYGPGAAFGANAGFGLGPNAGLGIGNGFGPAAGFGPANRLGCGGCGRGMVY